MFINQIITSRRFFFNFLPTKELQRDEKGGNSLLDEKVATNYGLLQTIPECAANILSTLHSEPSLENPLPSMNFGYDGYESSVKGISFLDQRNLCVDIKKLRTMMISLWRARSVLTLPWIFFSQLHIRCQCQ